MLVVITLLLIWRAFIYEASNKQAAIVEDESDAPLAPAPTPAQSDLILDLFNPSEQALDAQLNSSGLKRQIEEAITINFILRKCDLISQREYRETYQALILYAERSGLAASQAAAAQEIDNINRSASASYSLIYARTRCNQAQLSTARDQLASWRNALLGR